MSRPTKKNQKKKKKEKKRTVDLDHYEKAMSSYDNIPADLLVTATFQLGPEDTNGKDIEHINVRELVAGIRRFSRAETKYLTSDGTEMTSDDNFVRHVFSRLVSRHDAFLIDMNVLSCDLLPSKGNTATQSVLCLLRSIVDAGKKQEEEQVKINISSLFTSKPQADIELPEMLSPYVSRSDIENWLRTH